MAEVVLEAGSGYLKAMGNPEGSHALAREWIGTCLARAFGLSTLNYGLVDIDSSVDEIPLSSGGKAISGTAWVTETEPGHVWGGTESELIQLDNPQDIARLVLFDTWIRNRDRFAPPDMNRNPNYGNVFFSSRHSAPGQYRLLAIDHTHVFTENSTLTHRIAHITAIRDERLYGCFPQFVTYLNAQQLEPIAEELGNFDPPRIRRIMEALPTDWDVAGGVREALNDFLIQRSRFVANHWQNLLL